MLSSIVETIANSVSAKNRTRKWLQFLEWAKTTPATTILDIGVNTIEYSENDNLLERLYSYPANITAVGLETDWDEFRTRYPEVKTQTADGTKLPFSDNSFDIAYSNAVIEHVGNREKQLIFLKEMHRVGKHGYCTTPNRFFPIEVHTRIPLLHILLSKSLFDRIATLIGKSWATGDYMHLLSERELRALLEQAGITEYTLIKNRFFSFPMTITVYWTK